MFLTWRFPRPLSSVSKIQGMISKCLLNDTLNVPLSNERTVVLYRCNCLKLFKSVYQNPSYWNCLQNIWLSPSQRPNIMDRCVLNAPFTPSLWSDLASSFRGQETKSNITAIITGRYDHNVPLRPPLSLTVISTSILMRGIFGTPPIPKYLCY